MNFDDLGPLGFGAAAIGNLYRATPDEDAAATVRAAWDAGIRYFDTAPHYGFGLSEKRLGAALSALDPGESAIVSTKVGRRLDPRPDADPGRPRQGFVTPEPFESVFDYSYDGAMRSYEASRQRLRRERIDILYVHDVGRATHGDDHPRRFAEFLDGGYRAMRELREAGAVGAIGLGVNEYQVVEEMLEHGDLDVVLLAGRYTLLEQEALASFLPSCERRGVRIVIGGPFNSGILATGVRAGGTPHYNYEPAPPAIVERVAAIEALCDRHGVPLAAAALQFPLAHPQVAAAIPGMGSPDQVADARRLLATPIPATLWIELKEQGLIRADAPVPSAQKEDA
ncbi:aldo/keto reductase [Sphingomonas cannabina]|uniref:aldo/keto reductase n=1 Tax=Sphingomonas cannabina TaxID=2899123 RepID=UPI001F368C27|nr:aldo/keto reductase [Sphingomonas cannabina]UIJ45328.1 aldo/keto reductase [Sphingomonas cannabina]